MSMTVEVPLGNNSYNIYIDKVFHFEKLREILPQGTRIVAIGDSNTIPLFGDDVAKVLSTLGFRVSQYSFTAGEASKTINTLTDIYTYLARQKIDRKSCLLALGGGVTGDITGLAAATWLRGIRYIQVPTTLLAQVDSSVGGKTAIDLPYGKNLIGAFWQPIAVFCNISVLEILPQREFFAGLSEVIKYACIIDSDFFNWMELHINEILALESNCLSKMIAHCCTLKASITSIDEKDSEVRAILNFGHTIGHAIESVFGYNTYTHGEAVSIGQIIAAKISEKVLELTKAESQRICALLFKAHLPTSIQQQLGKNVLVEKLLSAMELDKKAASGIPKFVLLQKLGNAKHGCTVPLKLIQQCIENCMFFPK